jgi:outer membrane receptor for ferrienterochelin and colicins
MRWMAIAVVCLGTFIPDCVAQTGSVSGRVTGQDGAGLPGINVVIFGTTRGAATDLDGRYLIPDLPFGPARVVASGIGYESETRDIEISTRPIVLDFVLLESVLLSGEVVVTASRRPQAALDTPASVAVLSTSDLEARNIVALDDALRYIPGVTVQENQVNVRGSSGFAYNVGSRVLLLLDGMPLLTPDTDGMPFDSLPIAQIERIEVLKGPGSALYGGGALGGVVNVITRSIPASPETRISAFAGAHAPVRYSEWQKGYREAARFRPFGGFTLSHARRLSSTVGGWANLAIRRDQGYLNFSRASFAQGFAKIQWRPGPSIRADLLAGLLLREKDNFLFWNGARDALNPGTLAIGSQGTGSTPTGTNDISANQISLLPSFTHILGDKLFYAVRGRLFGTILIPIDENGKTKSLDDGTLGIRYGGEVQLDYEHSANRHFTVGISGDALATQSSFFVTADGDSTGGQPESALFGQWDEMIGHTTIAGGLRLDRYSIDTGTTIQRLSPKLALSRRVAPGTSIRVAYGHGFRVPSLAERFTDNQDFFPIVRNLALQPERSTSFEIGVRSGQRVGHDIEWEIDAAAFTSDYWDLIEPKLVPELAAFQFVNLTRARIAGAELSLEVRSPTTEWRVGYTFLDAEDKTLGQPLASRSRHQINLGADVKVLPWLDLGADWRGLSAPERVDTDFALFVRDADFLVAMRVLDVRASLTRGPVRIAVLLNNALDYYYLERPAYLAPPRHVQLRIQADL